jgi:tetratricopeptide (TPR) repeat protein
MVASLAAAVAAALVAGTTLSTWQAVRATQAERLAEDHLSAERQVADNALTAEAAGVHASAAGPLWNRGRSDEAAEHYHAAVAILEKRARKFPTQSDDTRIFSDMAIYLARIMAYGARTTDVQETCRLCLRATEILDGKLKQDPIRRAFLAVAVRAYAERLLKEPERRPEAEQMMTWSTPIVEQTIKDVALLDKLTADRTASVIDRHHAGETQRCLAKILAWTNRDAEAEEMALRAIRSFEASDERFMIPFALEDHCQYLTEQVEQLVQSGRADEAVKLVYKLIDAFDTLAAEHPLSAELYAPFQVDIQFQLTAILVAGGHAQEALVAARKSVDISEVLTREYPKNSEYRERLTAAQRVLAEQLAKNGPKDD